MARSDAPPQRPQDVLLPNEVVKSLRADLGGERLGTLLLSLGEEVGFYHGRRSFE
jgi:hypothetical protein